MESHISHCGRCLSLTRYDFMPPGGRRCRWCKRYGQNVRQIDDKGYAIPYESRDRDVVKIGVEFSSALRTIKAWETV